MVRSLHVLDATGHTTLNYSDDLLEQIDGIMSVDEAEKAFNDHLGNGGMAYADRGPGDGVVLKTFDPSEKEITLVPRLIGG